MAETGDAAKRPIVLKRKKVVGHGHHGGAWKVAYADFVTALMALFIVLWLMGSDDEVKAAISGYFKDPSGTGNLTGSAVAGAGNSINVPRQDMGKLREKIEAALREMPQFGALKDHVEMTITPDGLRIELLESEAGVFFDSGRPLPNPIGNELLAHLAREVGKLPNSVSIEGHTDSKPYPSGEYTNWELSTDRANAARKIMEASGLHPDQIAEVRGYADRQLRHPENPQSASNRRISLIVRYLPAPQAEKKESPASEPSVPPKGH